MLRFAVAPEGDRIRRAASIMASTAELRFLRRFKGAMAAPAWTGA